MNRIVLAACLGFALGLHACAPQVDTAAEEADIRNLITEHFAASESQDWAALSGFVSDDWTLFSHLGDAIDLAEAQQWFTDHITDHTITLSNVEVTVSGDGSMAWARLEEDTQYKYDGAPVDERARFTMILEKEDDAWKVVHLQRTVEATPPM